MPLQFARGRETATPTKANTRIIVNDLPGPMSSLPPCPPGYRVLPATEEVESPGSVVTDEEGASPGSVVSFSSWSSFSSSARAWASEASTLLASKAAQASEAAVPLAEQALSSLQVTAAAAADAAATAASQASESVQESAVRARQNAEVAIRIKALRAEVRILESNIEQWKKEWGLLCFDIYFEGDHATCSSQVGESSSK